MKNKKSTALKEHENSQWLEYVQLEIRSVQDDLHEVQYKMETILLHGYDPETQILTTTSKLDYDRLEKREQQLLNRLKELELQVEIQKPTNVIPTRDAETEVDEWAIVEAYEKEQAALREIQQIRERNSGRENEIER